MRSLGEFVGHVWRGIRTDPAGLGKAPSAARTTVEEQVRDEPNGRVILRRTTIEEVVLPRQGGGEGKA